jgi:hypothetical protein
MFSRRQIFSRGRCVFLVVASGIVAITCLYIPPWAETSREVRRNTSDSKLAREEPEASRAVRIESPEARSRAIDPTDFEQMHSALARALACGPAERGDADEIMCELIAELSAANAAAIVQSLSPAELDTAFGSAALTVWVRDDANAAARWIRDLPGATAVQAGVVARALAERPQALADFCERLDDRAWAQDFLASASMVELATHPEAAVILAENLPPGPPQTRLFESIASDWMNRDAAAAFAWILSVSDEDLRERLIAIGTESFATTDPLRASEWLVSAASRDATVRDALPAIVGIWREVAPEQAAHFTELLPDGEIRNAAAPAMAPRRL